MADPVTISVIIPVYNSAGDLERCLAALARSTTPCRECLVADDGSTDASCAVARRYGATVIDLGENRGPAFARNRAAEAATGDVLLFIDADVCVQPGTAAAVAEAFARHPEIAALMGSYDDQPADRHFLSQYKNLFHHFTHQEGREEASTFWSGCGAVRRSVFLELGGFHEGYARPCIEDIELGFRLKRAGYRIRLEKAIQVTHLKRWRFLNLLRTEVCQRGVPWIALMLRDRHAVSDLNLGWSTRAGAALTALLALSLALPLLGVHPLGLPGALALPAACLAGILILQRSFYAFFTRQRGVFFAAAVLPMHLLYFVYSSLCVPLGALAYLRDRRQARRRGAGPGALPSRPLACRRTIRLEEASASAS